MEKKNLKNQRQEEKVDTLIAKAVMNMEFSKEDMRKYLLSLRQAQFFSRGFDVVSAIDRINMSRSARFKLIKCFANHRAIDDDVVAFVYASIEAQVHADALR